MLFPADIGIELGPSFLNTTALSAGLLRRWTELDFEPCACRDALASAMTETGIPSSYFDLGAFARGDRPATDELLFGAFANDEPWTFAFVSRRLQRHWSGEIEPDSVEGMAELIRIATRSEDRRTFLEMYEESLDPEEIQALIEDERGVPKSRWPTIDRPGIYRREHASLIFYSGQTSIVTDPQGFARGWTTNGSRYPSDDHLIEADGICLTHTHSDHWHLPSMLRWATEKTTVICPPVERRSILSPEDPAASCRLAGLRAEAPAWWSRRTIGDIALSILPFYGEQPVRHPPALAAPVRNWGSCYRFSMNGMSVMILVDSGSDPMGDAIAMIERSVALDGPVDVLMSCCSEFPEALNPGLPDYLLVIPFDRLREVHEGRKRGQYVSMTLGVRGVVEACRAARARYFLPYAHGFAGLARDPRSAEGGGERESETGVELRKRLADEGLATELVQWMPGDSLHMDDGRLQVHRASADPHG